MGELKKLARDAERRLDKGNGYASDAAFLYAYAGDYDPAMHWFEKAYDDRDGVLFQGGIWDPDMPVALKATPRWQAFLRRPAFVEMVRLRAEIIARGAGG
jgi:hypothetical protein